MSKWNKLLIAVDFDGTISKYDGWKGEGVFGPPIDGAKEWIEALVADGGRWGLFTTRAEKERDALILWLGTNGFPTPEVITNKKLMEFSFFVDDRTLPRWTPDFFKTPFKGSSPWWRQQEQPQ